MTGTSWNGHRFFGLRTAKSNQTAKPGRRRGVCDGASLDVAPIEPTQNGKARRGAGSLSVTGAATGEMALVRAGRASGEQEGGFAVRSEKPKATLRCAVYTRVSTEHGLEQEFNSLDNQREASEAYVKSQANEGWKLIRTRYDDGGYSGGSMERPALQKLLGDVGARRIDVVVVYKVDRLTRSLADFAKLVELFDAHQVSFVSVTQAFTPRPAWDD